MTIYKFEQTKELKQIMNMHTTLLLLNYVALSQTLSKYIFLLLETEANFYL